MPIPTQIPTQTNTTPVMAWEAPATSPVERGKRWYLVMGVLCSGIIAYGVLSGAWSLSVTFGMLAGLYLITKDHRPRRVHIEITPQGISQNGTMLLWNECKEFWILQGNLRSELHIAREQSWKPDFIVQLGDADPYAVRDALGQFLPQNPHAREKILDSIIRFCKL